MMIIIIMLITEIKINKKGYGEVCMASTSCVFSFASVSYVTADPGGLFLPADCVWTCGFV